MSRDQSAHRASGHEASEPYGGENVGDFLKHTYSGSVPVEELLRGFACFAADQWLVQ